VKSRTATRGFRASTDHRRPLQPRGRNFSLVQRTGDAGVGVGPAGVRRAA
jgi:hypothetical protein